MLKVRNFVNGRPVLDSNYLLLIGNVKTISGQFKKSDLCVEHQLNVGVKPSLARSSIDQKLGRPATYGKLIPGFLILFPLSLCERKRSSYVSEFSISTLYSHSQSSSGQYSSHSCPCESGCCHFV